MTVWLALHMYGKLLLTTQFGTQVRKDNLYCDHSDAISDCSRSCPLTGGGSYKLRLHSWVRGQWRKRYGSIMSIIIITAQYCVREKNNKKPNNFLFLGGLLIFTQKWWKFIMFVKIRITTVFVGMPHFHVFPRPNCGWKYTIIHFSMTYGSQRSYGLKTPPLEQQRESNSNCPAPMLYGKTAGCRQ